MGLRPMNREMPTGLPGPSSMKSTSLRRTMAGFPSRICTAARWCCHDLLGRDAVETLAEGPHELDAPARDDIRLERPRPQERQELQHGLVDALRVKRVEPWVMCGGHPVAYQESKIVVGHAAVRGRDQLDESFRRSRKFPPIAFKKSFERLGLGPFGMLGARRGRGR